VQEDDWAGSADGTAVHRDTRQSDVRVGSETLPITLVATWIREVSTLRQLVVVSDSRATGGEVWDWCPKVLPLPRPSTIAAVAGDLGVSYAYLVQAVSATMLETGNRTGRVDLGNFVAQIERLLKPARSQEHLTDLTPAGDILDAELLIGGWSWRRSRFEAFKFFRDSAGDIQKQDALRGHMDTNGVHFFGSGWGDARDRLVARLRALNQPASVQWEPLEALLEMCADPDVREVGGAPQIVVANQHGVTDQFLVPSPGNDDELWFGGRPLGRQRSDLRALRFITNDAGRFDVEPYYPEGLSIASAEILRARRAAEPASAPAGPEFDAVGAAADQLTANENVPSATDQTPSARTATDHPPGARQSAESPREH
jgi:hypothetical protein